MIFKTLKLLQPVSIRTEGYVGIHAGDDGDGHSKHRLRGEGGGCLSFFTIPFIDFFSYT